MAQKLASEVHAERLTRLDQMLIAEQRDHGFIDLRPGQHQSYLIRKNRHLLIDRAKRLERYRLAAEAEPGRWVVSDRAEAMLKALGARQDTVETIHRALADHGLADERGIDQYVLRGLGTGERIVGRVIGRLATRWASGSISSSMASMAGSITSNSPAPTRSSRCGAA